MSGIRSQICLLAALLLPAPAEAHPHVWIETHAVFDVEQGKLTAIDLDWLFDDIFSAQLIEDFDHGHKGSFDARDTADLNSQVLPGYADFGYFTHVRIDGREVKITKVGNFQPTLEKGQVRFRFTAYLPEPVDPRHHKVEAGFYDETFFCDLGFSAHDPMTAKGDPACSVTIAEDPAHKIYFGQVVPEKVVMTCK